MTKEELLEFLEEVDDNTFIYMNIRKEIRLLRTVEYINEDGYEYVVLDWKELEE